MAREIKFRAWDKKNNKMSITFSLGDACYEGFPVPFVDEDTDECDTEYDYGLVMQYTGLKDKNGVEIFDKDIIKAPDGIWEVDWQDAENLALINNHKEENSIQHADNDYSLVDCEVISNIYENPELIKENDTPEIK